MDYNQNNNAIHPNNTIIFNNTTLPSKIYQPINKILFLEDNNIKYFKDNNFYIIPDKTIETLTVEDFLFYGSEHLNTIINNITNNTIKILSLQEKITYKFLKNPTIIYNLLDKKRFNIQKIKKLIINDTGNIIYIIHNGENFYTWYNNEWGKFYPYSDISSNTDVSSMIRFGMTSSIINQLTEENWSKLWSTIDSYKYINILSILPYQNFDDEVILKNINILKDGFIYKKEIKDNVFDEYQTYQDFIIQWNTVDKSKIEIIYGL